MTDLTYTVKIDGAIYSSAQLDRLQYERTLHGLHEMKRLGADIRDGDKVLSHIDINWLEPERAEQISLDVRSALGEEGVLELFKDVLADSERRFKEFGAGYVEGDVHTAETEIEVTGVGVQETLSVVAGGSNERDALAAMPEHYIIIGDVTTGQRGMETFGLFGEPVYVHGTAFPEVPSAMPFEKDPTFPMSIYGQFLLKSDDTPIHVGAFHQIRPEADGFFIKSIFFCPKAAPKAIAEGHKLHFAIEIVNSARIAHAAGRGV